MPDFVHALQCTNDSHLIQRAPAECSLGVQWNDPDVCSFLEFENGIR